MSIYEMIETALRQNYRFPSSRGYVSLEDVYNVRKLDGDKNGFDLDTIAKQINVELRASSEESFVKEASSASVELTIKLELVKHIIALKKQERDQAQALAAYEFQAAKLQKLIDAKKDEGLGNEPVENLEARLKGLREAITAAKGQGATL